MFLIAAAALWLNFGVVAPAYTILLNTAKKIRRGFCFFPPRWAVRKEKNKKMFHAFLSYDLRETLTIKYLQTI